MIFDTHCHYNLEPIFSQNRSEPGYWRAEWQEAQAHGVTHSTVIGTDLPTSELALEIANQEVNLFAAIGIHPGIYQERVTKKVTLPNLNSELVELEKDVQSLRELAQKKPTD